MTGMSKFRTQLVVCTIVSAVALVSYAEPTASSESVKAPAISLEEAALKGNTDAVRQHLAAGTDLNTKNPMSGGTPLIAAATFGQNETALLLIEGGADLEVKNNEGATADAQQHLALSQLRAIMGLDAQAREHLERAKHLGLNDPVSILALAQAHALLGDYETALTEVARALDEGYPDPYTPLYLPSLRPLRSDSRFLALYAPPVEAIEIDADRDHATGELLGDQSEQETGGSADEWWKKK